MIKGQRKNKSLSKKLNKLEPTFAGKKVFRLANANHKTEYKIVSQSMGDIMSQEVGGWKYIKTVVAFCWGSSSKRILSGKKYPHWRYSVM